MEVEGNHLLHAVFDHLRGEEVGFSLLVDGDLPEVLQQDGADGLGGVGHVDGAVVAHHLAHVGQRPAVVQVEMTGEGPEEAVSRLTSEEAFKRCERDSSQPDDHTIQEVGQAAVLRHVREVWEASLRRKRDNEAHRLGAQNYERVPEFLHFQAKTLFWL